MRYSHYSQNWLSLPSRLRFAVFLVCLFLILICWRFSTFFHPNLRGQTWTVMLIVISVTVGADVNVLKKHRKGRKKMGWEKESDRKVAVGAVFCVYASLSSLVYSQRPIQSHFHFFFLTCESFISVLPLPAISPLFPPA